MVGLLVDADFLLSIAVVKAGTERVIGAHSLAFLLSFALWLLFLLFLLPTPRFF